VGFIYNRIWAAIKRESLAVVAEGVSTPEVVDRLFQSVLGSHDGPFRIMDKVGLDVDLILEGDILTALQRQGLTCVGRCRDFESQTFDNLPGAMHLSGVAGGQFAWSDP
jgi:hypothetical protein